MTSPAVVITPRRFVSQCELPHRTPCLAYPPVIRGEKKPCQVCAEAVQKIHQFIPQTKKSQ